MRQPAALFPIALALGAIVLVPEACAREPIPIKACQTISQAGSYELANNLTATGDCLVITASFVTIDLAGFSISTTSGAAIKATPSASPLLGIAVRNGSISSSLGEGVALAERDQAGNLTDGADGSIVENLRVSTGGDGIRAKGIVRGNTVEGGVPFANQITASGVVTDNYVTGAERRGNGIVATGVVRGNAAINSGATGIGVGVGSTVIGNTAIGNFFNGIRADCPSNLTDNTAVNTVSDSDLVLVGQDCHNEDNVAPKQ